MPPVGKRIIKSAIAVFLCLCIDLLRNHQGMPFYSAIAAILCIQPYVKNSLQAAWNRVTGTLIGGVYGVLFLVLERDFFTVDYMILFYALVSAAIILVIYTTVLCRKQESAYIACVVFLGIVLTHGADVDAYSFALNRMLDTLLGIAVALAVNTADTWKQRDADTLYAIHLDYVLMEAGKLTQYAVVKTNQLIERGAKIVLMTRKDPCSVLPQITGVNSEYPLICMNGALIYDMDKKVFLLHEDIARNVVHEIVDALEVLDVYYLIYSCRHDFLYIYYKDTNCAAEEKLLEGMSEGYHSHYVKRRISPQFTAFSIHAVISEAEQEKLIQLLHSYADEIEVVVYHDEEMQELLHMEIYKKGVSEEAAVKYVQKELGIRDALVFGAVEKPADQIELFQTIEKVYHGF